MGSFFKITIIKVVFNPVMLLWCSPDLWFSCSEVSPSYRPFFFIASEFVDACVDGHYVGHWMEVFIFLLLCDEMISCSKYIRLYVQLLQLFSTSCQSPNFAASVRFLSKSSTTTSSINCRFRSSSTYAGKRRVHLSNWVTASSNDEYQGQVQYRSGVSAMYFYRYPGDAESLVKV